MKKIILMAVLAMMTPLGIQAQKQPVGMRVVALYDKDVDTTAEFQGRATTSAFKLGEPITTTCIVVKKVLGGKRLQFLFPEGKRQARAYLSKSILKELRTSFKFDIKLHPKQHRKQ